MPIVRLTDRAVLAVSGKDAKPFLQGLITNNIEKAGPDSPVYAALLTPQGKVLFDFIVHADGDGYLVDASAVQSEDLLKRLKMYRLRAAVDLQMRGDLAVFAAWDDGAQGHAIDPRLAGLGARWIAGQDAHQPDAGLNAYVDRRLKLGVPDSLDVIGEFLLDANGEELHGIDFKKGCFVGQEVTARMKHKAQPRRRIMPVTIGGDLPPPDTALRNQAGLNAGELKGGNGKRALASVRLDRLDGAPLVFDDGSASVERAAYALPGQSAV